MANITILRKSTSSDTSLQGYRMTLEVSAAQDITSKIFVKQRLRDFSNNTFEDFFVAIATPAQIEDFAEDSPNEGSSYYRTNKIDILARNLDYLESVFNDIVSEVQKLVTDSEVLSILNSDGTYNISSAQITVS